MSRGKKTDKTETNIRLMEKREWKPIEGFDFKEILFDEFDGIVSLT